jgi:hypothetical protein
MAGLKTRFLLFNCFLPLQAQTRWVAGQARPWRMRKRLCGQSSIALTRARYGFVKQLNCMKIFLFGAEGAMRDVPVSILARARESGVKTRSRLENGAFTGA